MKGKQTEEHEYKCFHCGARFRFPSSNFQMAGQCPNCGRHTIFIRTDTPYDIKRYFDKGRFLSKKLADDIMSQHAFVTFNDTEEVYFYEGGIYKPKGEILIKQICEEVLDIRANTHRINEVINHIRRSSYIDRNEIMDSNPHFLCVNNGILDLRKIKEGKIKLLPHTPEMVFLNKLNIGYNPDADCPKIMAFLNQIIREEDLNLLQEMVGYTLWKDYSIQKAFVLLGEGNNGKSTFLQLLTKLLGKHNVSSVSLQELENNRFAAASLYGKLANIYADLPSKILRNTSKFKMLTGGDIITAEQKFKNPFKFYNHAKIIFSTNELPRTHDDTAAFFRRWILIDFPNRFEDDKADTHILEKIATPEELSGFLNWALKGLARLLKNGKFSTTETTEEVRRHYIMASDPIHAFVDYCLMQDTEGVIPKELIYATFVGYCNNKKLPVASKQVFSRDLPKFIAVSEQRPKIGERQERCYSGIKLTEYCKQFIPQELSEKYTSIMDKIVEGRDAK